MVLSIIHILPNLLMSKPVGLEAWSKTSPPYIGLIFV